MNRRKFFFALIGAPVVAVAKPKVTRPLDSEYLKDLAFFTGDQWPAEVVAKRVAMGRPCLTINRLPEMLRTNLKKDVPAAISTIVQQNLDKQRLYNYLCSASVESYGMVPWPDWNGM